MINFRFLPLTIAGTGKWYVYVLTDNWRRRFYIGMSGNVVKRAAQHLSTKGPIREYIERVVTDGGSVLIDVIGTYDSREDALKAEAAAILVADIPLLNRQMLARPPKPQMRRTVLRRTPLTPRPSLP